MNCRLMHRILFLVALLLSLGGCATHNTISDGDDSRLMLKGHDPVSYFTLAAPAPGSPAIKARVGSKNQISIERYRADCTSALTNCSYH